MIIFGFADPRPSQSHRTRTKQPKQAKSTAIPAKVINAPSQLSAADAPNRLGGHPRRCGSREWAREGTRPFATEMAQTCAAMPDRSKRRRSAAEGVPSPARGKPRPQRASPSHGGKGAGAGGVCYGTKSRPMAPGRAHAARHGREESLFPRLGAWVYADDITRYTRRADAAAIAGRAAGVAPH